MGDLEIASGAGDIHVSAGAASDIAAKEASGYGPPRWSQGSVLAQNRRLAPSLSAKTAFHWGVAKR